MKHTIIVLLIASIIGLFVVGCNKTEFEVFDHPFIHIHVNNQDTIQVRFDRRDTVNYNVYLSAQLQFEPIQVDWTFSTKNLVEGEDFKILNPSSTLTLNPGIFEAPIQIAWLDKPLTSAQEHSLSLTITSNSKGYTIGLPGPDHLQKSLTILKIQ